MVDGKGEVPPVAARDFDCNSENVMVGVGILVVQRDVRVKSRRNHWGFARDFRTSVAD